MILKLNIAKIISAAGTGPGCVVVRVLTQSNPPEDLGRTLFTYYDEVEQVLEQLVRNRKMQGKFFKKYSKQYESDESDENDEKRRKQDTGNSSELHPSFF